MGRTPLAAAIRIACSLAGPADGHGLEDSQLLQRYVRLRDGDAFAVLVQRHGRLVWTICRRLLRCEADAEDAFQATFLALARHARSIRAGKALPSWLYRVARRIAAKAVRERENLRTAGSAAERPARASPGEDLCARELRAVIEEELHRLPEKYQTPFLLCCLEGKSKAEAARQLGWKEGTVSGRLAEARKRMRCSLLRRGVAPVAVTAVLAPDSAQAAVPGPLVVNTIRLAGGAKDAPVPANIAQLAKGACTAMSTRKWIIVAVLMVSGLLASGRFWLGSPAVEAHTSTDRPHLEEPPPPEPPAPRPEDPLDQALRRWRAAMDQVQTATCEVTRTEFDIASRTDAVFQGTFRYLKADKCWALEMHDRKDHKKLEKFVRFDKDFYAYGPTTREVYKCRQPLSWPPSVLDSHPVVILLSGMTPAQARERFEWKLVKEDQWYIYLRFEPKSKQDRAVFSSARLVLNRDSHLPRQLYFVDCTGNQVMWDITKLDTAVELRKADFTPKVPDGWRLVPVD